MTDHLYQAANDIVPKFKTGEAASRMDDIDKVCSDWNSPRSRLYIALTLMAVEREVRVLNTKIKLLEALRSERQA